MEEILLLFTEFLTFVSSSRVWYLSLLKFWLNLEEKKTSRCKDSGDFRFIEAEEALIKLIFFDKDFYFEILVSYVFSNEFEFQLVVDYGLTLFRGFGDFDLRLFDEFELL